MGSLVGVLGQRASAGTTAVSTPAGGMALPVPAAGCEAPVRMCLGMDPDVPGRLCSTVSR